VLSRLRIGESKSVRFVLFFMCAGMGAMPAGAVDQFHWGINGHPTAQVGYYHVPLETQLDLVAQLGMKWYRCDWSEKGLKDAPERYDRLVAEAAKRGVRILPIIFPTISCRSEEASLKEIQRASFEFARSLARRYQGKITHYELSNELDGWAMIRKGETTRDGTVWKWGDPDGTKPEHFEERRYQKVRAELLGLHAGIKAGDPNAMTIVDSCGWLHYGFFERLVREDRVPFDILAWHWYSEMGDITNVRGEFNLLEHLKGYGKPIWITEINRRDGSLGSHEQEQADYLAATARKMCANPDIEAFFVYELLDEPYFGADNPESHYGLVEIVRGADDRWKVHRKKPAFYALQTLIAETSRQSSQ